MSSFVEQIKAQYVADNATPPEEDNPAEQEKSKRPFSNLDFEKASGSFMLDNCPQNYDWLIEQSLRRACIGVIVGAPGCGKGMFVKQLLIAIASGGKCLNTWEVKQSLRCIYISAEDDHLVIHRRLHHALKQLPQSVQHEAAQNIHAFAVHGNVALYADGKVTANFKDLKKLIERYRPHVVVLDTVARFFAIKEGDNAAMTQALGYLEKLCHDYQVNFVLIHHTDKASGVLATDKQKLMDGLEQTALRGWTSLTGSARWQLNIMSLARSFASKTIGDNAGQRNDGTYVALRVCKKNAGHPEGIVYAQRGKHGLLQYVEPSKEEQQAQSVEDDAAALVAEIKRRAKENLDPLPASKAGNIVFNWGDTRTSRAVQYAISNGSLYKTKKPKGKGNILELREKHTFEKHEKHEG